MHLYDNQPSALIVPLRLFFSHELRREAKVRLKLIFSRGHATLELAVSVGRSARLSVTSRHISVFRFCPPVRDWGGVYTALLVADSVHQFVQLSVVLSVCCSIHWAVMTESKNVKISIFALPEYMGVEGGVKGGCTPAHPYCNPAVLV